MCEYVKIEDLGEKTQHKCLSIFLLGAHDSLVVKALCYKPGGRGFETL
jgi:hypothetical protein